MKVVPMIFRFSSGSDTPESLSMNRFEASSNWMLMPKLLRRSTTSADSPLRRQPLSTRKAWKRSPMAVFIKQAATDESTPPLTAPITCPVSPTVTRTWLMKVSATFCMDQVLGALQTVSAKFRSKSMPLGEWVTSGWNCIPNIFFSLCSKAASAHVSVAAIPLNPIGKVVTLSPWLIHIWVSPSNTSETNSLSVTVDRTIARPYSLSLLGDTTPPNL
mmetsp:Transcript_44769/g.57345  ORF Transcript_44769/g.57345 Transcript_44769/m.57345 type:complete len:217 (+) Transcript_44769:800-1450(+)